MARISNSILVLSNDYKVGEYGCPPEPSLSSTSSVEDLPPFGLRYQSLEPQTAQNAVPCERALAKSRKACSDNGESGPVKDPNNAIFPTPTFRSFFEGHLDFAPTLFKRATGCYPEPEYLPGGEWPRNRGKWVKYPSGDLT